MKRPALTNLTRDPSAIHVSNIATMRTEALMSTYDQLRCELLYQPLRPGASGRLSPQGRLLEAALREELYQRAGHARRLDASTCLGPHIGTTGHEARQERCRA